MNKAAITTHVLNLGTGRPAENMLVKLYAPNTENALCQAYTDADGRIMLWDQNIELQQGVWQLEFATDSWFAERQQNGFFSDVRLAFHVNVNEAHYHVPLLLNNYGYSSYRGS